MRVFVPAFLAVIIFTACTRESNVLQKAIQNSNLSLGALPVQATLKRGVFTATAGIRVMGTAKLVQQASGLKIQLDSFSVSAGPDLKVYLSQTAIPGNHLNLGNLQANSGVQYYPIPAGTNLSAYPFVLIHCQQYNHLFSYASLQ